MSNEENTITHEELLNRIEKLEERNKKSRINCIILFVVFSIINFIGIENIEEYLMNFAESDYFLLIFGLIQIILGLSLIIVYLYKRKVDKRNG